MKWEDFQTQKLNTLNMFNDGYTWMKTEIECPVCGESVYKNMSIVLASYPQQYKYRCPKCDWTETGY